MVVNVVYYMSKHFETLLSPSVLQQRHIIQDTEGPHNNPNTY